MIDSLEISHPLHQTTLSRFLSACHSTPHILAATLSGSHASGTADEWSDLDLGVVIADDAYDDFAAGREAFLRQLGEPLFVEDFDIPGIIFFILADGTEAELAWSRASDFTEPHGPWRPLLDKTGVLGRGRRTTDDGPQAADPDSRATADEIETLRRQIMWFWHDLSHFITALGRDQLWWAAGQFETLRRVCVVLARLAYDFDDEEAADDPYFKLDMTLPDAALAPLRETFVPLERAAMLAATRQLLAQYRELAAPLADANGISYPHDLDRLMQSRLERLSGR